MKGTSKERHSNLGDPKFRGRINSMPEPDMEEMIAQALGVPGKKRKDRGSLSEGEFRGLNLSYTSLVWDDDERRSVKKPKDTDEAERGRRLSVSGISNMRDKVAILIQNVDTELRFMRQVVRENKNTKVELKEGVERLSSMVSQLTTRDIYDALKGMEEARQVILLDDSDDKGRAGDQEDPTRKELTARLAEVEEEARRLKEKNALLTREIEALKGCKEQVTDQMLLNKSSYEEFKKLENLEWPSKVFKSAFFAAGSPLGSKANTDHLVIYEEGRHQKNSEGLRKAFEYRFPELKESEEGVGVIKICTKVANRDGTENVNERWLLRTEAGDDDSVWFDSLSRAKTILHEGKRNKVAVYPPGGDARGTMTRRMMEFIFRDSDIKCLVYTKTPQGEGTTKEKEARSRSNRPDALVVSQKGKTYSDLLKVIRDKIKPDSVAAKAVRTIREARDGRKMVIVLDKEGGTAIEQLKEEIQKMESVEIKNNARREEEVAFIQGIDELSTKEDVISAVCSETGLDREQVTVSELRRGFGGNRAITVRLPRGKAAGICEKGKLRIGLNWCPVKERVDVIRCFRCWRYGHLARECKEDKDESKLCRKCGGTGHMAANCAHRDWCLTCKAEGHTTGSGACPEFRKAVARERKARNRRREY